MTKEDALNKLAKCRANSDTATAHSDADDVLCELLAALGYGDVVCAYLKVNRWFE